MDSDDETLEAGVMQVDATVRAVETSESDRMSHVYIYNSCPKGAI